VNRLLAVVVAIGMVAGALYVRGRIDDEDDGGRGGGSGGDLTLVCDPQFESACREASDSVLVEDAATTAERLLGGERPPDAWLTPGPWADIVDALRSGQAPLYPAHGAVLASTRLALVSGPGGPSRWKALGTQTGEGDLRLGWRDPDSGLGVLQLGAFTAGWFGTDDVATNDFDPAFEDSLDRITNEAETASSPLGRRLQQGVSFAEAVITTETEARALLEQAAPGRRGDLRPLYPDPVVSVEAVLAGSGDVADDLRSALKDDGWGEPRPTNLPSPGVLAALWDRVRR
jgi:hypothetical protein